MACSLTLLTILSHPHLSGFHVANELFPLSLICYSLIRYFSSFLISVMIFCIMQCVVLMIQSLLIFIAPSSLTQLIALCPSLCLPVSSPCFRGLSLLLPCLHGMNSYFSFLVLCVSDPHFRQEICNS